MGLAFPKGMQSSFWCFFPSFPFHHGIGLLIVRFCFPCSYAFPLSCIMCFSPPLLPSSPLISRYRFSPLLFFSLQSSALLFLLLFLCANCFRVFEILLPPPHLYFSSFGPRLVPCLQPLPFSLSLFSSCRIRLSIPTPIAWVTCVFRLNFMLSPLR